MVIRIFLYLLVVFCLADAIALVVTNKETWKNGKTKKAEKIFYIHCLIFYLVAAGGFFYLARWGVLLVP